MYGCHMAVAVRLRYAILAVGVLYGCHMSVALRLRCAIRT